MCVHLSRTSVTKAFVCSVKLAPGTCCPGMFLGAKGVWTVQHYLGCGLSGLGGWYRIDLPFFFFCHKSFVVYQWSCLSVKIAWFRLWEELWCLGLICVVENVCLLSVFLCIPEKLAGMCLLGTPGCGEDYPETCLACTGSCLATSTRQQEPRRAEIGF